MFRREGLLSGRGLADGRRLQSLYAHSDFGRLHRGQLMRSTMCANMACSTVSTGPR